MKNLLKYTVLFVILSGCGPSFYLKKAERALNKAEQLGAKVTADTVYKNIEVITPKIEFDTVLRQVNFRDTITVTKDNVITRLKINTVTKEIFVHTECPPDTVRIKVPIIVNKEIKAGATTWDLVIGGIVMAIVFFAVGYVVRWVKK